jgi:hypothetical protein
MYFYTNLEMFSKYKFGELIGSGSLGQVIIA